MVDQSSRQEVAGFVIETAIKLTVLGVVLYWALKILEPFIVVVIWGAIIAVALSPMVGALEKRLKGRRTLIVSAITLTALLALLGPAFMLSETLFDSTKRLAHELRSGTLHVAPPPDSVAEWPVVGKKVHAVWSDAAADLQEMLHTYQSQLQTYGKKIVSAIGGILGGVLEFAASLVIAAFFLVKHEASIRLCDNVAARLVGGKGGEWVSLSAKTVQSVVQGVLGIAIIQALLAFAGFAAIGLPLAALWALAVLVFTIVQLPTLILMGPIIAYVFSYADTTSAIIFAAYGIFVGLSDNILKPLLLGRGVDIPMLVVLLGAIGGMLLYGLIGLFVGAVVLALAYKLFTAWLEGSPPAESRSGLPSPG